MRGGRRARAFRAWAYWGALGALVVLSSGRAADAAAPGDPGARPSARSNGSEADGVPSADTGARRLWVFFGARDAGRSKALLEAPERWVGSRALARRALRGRGPTVTEADLPVDGACRDAVRATGARIRTASRWLHAVSVVATPAESARIAALPCVASIRRVGSRAALEPEPPPADGADIMGGERPPNISQGPHALDYGPSAAQLAQIGVPALHDSSLSGAGLLVGLLDTGFERTHPAFSSTQILAEWDFVNDDTSTADEGIENVSGHGTAVLSAIAAHAPGEMIGVAYEATFVLAKTEIVSAEFPAEEDLWVAGLEWEESLGVDVVSSSLGYLAFPGETFYTYEEMDGETAVTTVAASMAVERGVVVVNAMGNERSNAWHYLIAPADAEAVISVGAVDGNGNATSFTSVGPTADGRLKPDVMALGLGTIVARTDFGGGSAYGPNSGTSFSTPLVAGVAALLLESRPASTPAQIQAALRQTASRCASPDTISGFGLVRADVARALLAAGVEPSEPVPAMTGPPGLRLHRPSGDLFAPSLGPLNWTLDVPVAGRVTARLFEPTGREVAVLLDGDEGAVCDLPLAWDGRGKSGNDLPSGVYFLRVATASGSASRRLVLVR